MVFANKFDCHSPAPVQKPVQVQESTNKEYGEDVGGAVSRKWEYGRQEKRREQATSDTVGTIHASVASSPARNLCDS